MGRLSGCFSPAAATVEAQSACPGMDVCQSVNPTWVWRARSPVEASADSWCLAAVSTRGRSLRECQRCERPRSSRKKPPSAESVPESVYCSCQPGERCVSCHSAQDQRPLGEGLRHACPRDSPYQHSYRPAVISIASRTSTHHSHRACPQPHVPCLWFHLDTSGNNISRVMILTWTPSDLCSTRYPCRPNVLP